jgi:TonB-linked SusC/RagA family outer membrane protein
MRKSLVKLCGRSIVRGIAVTALLLFPAMNVLHGSDLSAKTVKGNVVSATDKEPLIGATVKLTGTTVGTVTDIDGNFTIEADDGQTVEISYIGFVTQKVKVNGTTLNVVLKEEANSLNDVVVIGYGVQKKKLVTGATVQLKGDDISKLNTNNALQAMQGQTPGVNIISDNGQPGAGMKVIIRGQGSNTNNSPLYIIDGVPGDITNINPSDIQTIDVLKDAASAAIYGAQAANGVILVTTKTGKEGNAKVTFDGYYGWQNVSRKIDLLNADQYMTLMDEQALNSGNAAIDWKSYKSIYDASGNVNDTNWMDQMFKDNAVQQSYVIGLSGGNKDQTYAISSGYYNQEGIVGGSKASNYDRYNLRGVFEQHLYGDFLKVGENMSFSYIKSKGVGSGNMYGSALRGAYGTSPLMPVYLQTDGRADKNNGYSYSDSGDWNEYDYNAYASMMRGNSRSTSQNFVANVFAEIQPIKNLKLKTQFGYNLNNSQYRSFSPAYVATITTSSSLTSVGQNQFKGHTITWTNTAAYDWKLGTDHLFNAMVGMEIERYSGEHISATNTLLEIFQDWPSAWLSNASNTGAATALGYPDDDYRRISYFGRAGWNWKETYMVNATLRCDGSSRFAKDHRWGWFPSVSAGWVITNEQFMKNTASWLDFLKLRASWGQVGNNNIGSYLYASSVSLASTGYNFGTGKGSSANASGAYAKRLGNDNLKWETSEQSDLGIDARFLKGRLGLNVDGYYKKTKDWLVQAPIIGTAGAEAPYINGGSVTNKGVEVALTWNDNIGDFKYNIGGNFAYNKNEVGEIPTTDGMIHGSTSASALRDNMGEYYRCSNGHAMGYFWGYKTAGLFQNQQEISDWVAAGNGILANTAPGDIKVVDVNHDGVINDNDKVDLGNGIPKWNFGFNLGCQYKNFDFSVVFQGAAGFKIANGGYRNWGNNQGKANYTTYYLERWTGEGTSNKVPRLTSDDHNWTNFSDLWLENGDYLRISNVTLGYDFSKILNFKYISQARLYFQVQNLCTFTHYRGMDPEVGYGGEAWVSGIDAGAYPHARTILFGVNLKF